MPQDSPVARSGNSHTPLPHVVSTVPERVGCGDEMILDVDGENDGDAVGELDADDLTDLDGVGVIQQAPYSGWHFAASQKSAVWPQYPVLLQQKAGGQMMLSPDTPHMEPSEGEGVGIWDLDAR